MSIESPLALLLAAERSGTHFARSVINQNKAGRAFGEVANAAVDPEPGDQLNFFAFRRDFGLAHPGSFVPSVANTARLIEAYFDHCIEVGSASAKPLILDVKYGHLVNFTSGWWDVFSRPLIFDIAKARKVPVIHLIRRRLFETVISNIYASATGVWRASAPEELRATRITLDRDALLSRARLLKASIELCREWISANHFIEIYYEEIQALPSKSWSRLQSEIGVNVTAIKSYFIKTTPCYEEIIENYGDVKDLLQLTIDDPI